MKKKGNDTWQIEKKGKCDTSEIYLFQFSKNTFCGKINKIVSKKKKKKN